MFNKFFLKKKIKLLINKKIKINRNSNDIKEFLFEINNFNIINKYKIDVNKFKNSYLVSKADLENQKKISSNELTKVSKFAIENFAENLLTILDSLESALKVKTNNNEKLLEGIRLILKLLINNFEKNNIKQILPDINEKFDPYKHLAISTVNLKNLDNNLIVNVLQKGYYIFERILRPALVVVNKVD